MSPRPILDLVSATVTLKGMADDMRPRFLDLRRIRLPVTALTSILHRISGVLLFLSLPLLLLLLDRSLVSVQGFEQVQSLWDSLLIKAALLPLLWWLLHHLLAGARVLLLDVDWGVDIITARRSARWVNLGAVLLSLIGWGLLL